MNYAESTIYNRLYLITVVLGLLVFFWGLGDIGLMSFNEARRALPAQAMFLQGDWLLPHLNGELYLAKPPLLYWLAASASFLFGAANEWAVRLPSALAAAATVWMVYRYALRQFGAWPALFSAQLLIANVTFAMFARRAEIEMLLTALCAGALLAAIHYIREGGSRKWIYLSYLLLALAMLTKGPLVLLFVTLPLLLVALYQKDQHCWEVLRSPLGWGIFVLVGLSWYAVVTWRLGPEIWASITHRDMLEKIQGDGAKPPYSYLLWILMDFLPVAFLLFIRPANIWQRCKGRTDYMVLLAAVVVPLLIFSLFNNKHAKYFLPAYPLLALILGMHLGEFFDKAGPYLKRTIIALGLLLPTLYLVYYAVAEARIFDYRVTAFYEFSDWSRQPQPGPFYVYRDVDERLLYYSAKPIKLLDESAFKQLRDSHSSMLLLVESRYLAEVKPQADCLVKEFKPYLKKDKALTVLGFGNSCS
jgi:4-amino-4-deoxy-L-arabinose transferase-like glycosyltransferase